MAGNGVNGILQERKKRIFGWRSFVFFIISIALVAFLLSRVDMRAVVTTIANANVPLVLLSCGVYFVSNYCKSYRYRVMLRDLNVGDFQMFAITSYQNFFNQILPARTGELTLIYYLKKIGGADLSKGLHVLLVTRIYDFIIVAAFFVCSLVLYYGRHTSAGLLLVGVLVFILSLVCLFNLKWVVIACNQVFILAMKALKLERKAFVVKIIEKMDPVVREFSDYRTARHLPALALTSVLVWGVLYVFSYITIRAFGVNINFLLSVAGNTGQVLANVLPVNSFGSFGTLEAGWSGGFVLVGMSPQDAITTGFGYHLINFVAAAAIAAVCWVVIRLRK